MASQAMNGSMPVHDAGQYSFFDSTGDEGGLEGGLDDGLEGGLEVNIIFSLHGMAARDAFLCTCCVTAGAS